MESSKRWVLTKKELFRKDINEKSEISIPDMLSQFKESVSHNWSEFLYVCIQVESKKVLKLVNYFDNRLLIKNFCSQAHDASKGRNKRITA